MSVAAAIKMHIESNGRTQSYINKKTGLSPSQLTNSLNGKRKITIEEYELICRALGVPVDTFLGDATPRAS